MALMVSPARNPSETRTTTFRPFKLGEAPHHAVQGLQGHAGVALE